MSRIGKRPIPLPKGVTVTTSGSTWEVKGPKGTLRRTLHDVVTVKTDNGVVHVGMKNDVNAADASRLQGLTRALINGAVQGVSAGYTRNLKLEGTGYNAVFAGQKLTLKLGLSHPVEIQLPEGIKGRVTPESKGTVIVLEGIDKELLGQVTSNIRSIRPPEPYKGKGVQVEGEKIRRKAGKAAGK